MLEIRIYNFLYPYYGVMWNSVDKITDLVFETELFLFNEYLGKSLHILQDLLQLCYFDFWFLTEDA